MTTFEFSGVSPKSDIPCEKYPLRRVEPSLRKFVKVLHIDLERLNRHRSNIEKLELMGQWESLNREQINASRTVQQLKANIKQLEHTRLQVCHEDLVAFDARVKDIQEQAIVGVVEFLNIHGEQQELPLVGVASEPPPLSSSAPQQMSRSSVLHHPMSSGQPEDVSSVSPGTEQALPFPLQEQLVLHEGPQIDEQSQQSWYQLREGLVELNGMIHDFSTMVQDQQEKVDHIEQNIEDAQENVHQGTLTLAKTSKLKAAIFPVAGAILGGAVGGPVGLVAGLKLGGLAAVGGGIIGLTGGTLWKRRQNHITNVELQNLSRSGSRSLPDLSQEDDDSEEKSLAAIRS